MELMEEMEIEISIGMKKKLSKEFVEEKKVTDRTVSGPVHFQRFILYFL